MPWKEPGKGDKDPWSSGSQQPPDLDEVFKNVGSKVRSLFGGGGSGRRTSDSSGGSGGIYSIHTIDAAERGVVLRFGKFARELGPGINLTLPRPFEALYKVNTSNVRSVDDRGHMLTEDENLVEFNYQVQYRIASAQDFLFKVRSPEITLREASESALRESVGTNSLDDMLEGSTRILVRQETRRNLQETLDNYQAGLLITQFNLTDVTVPAQVQEAYSDVIRAREDRERFIEEARVHANSVVPEARGRAARVVQEAQGYRDATIALAEGEANRVSQVLTEYRLAPEVTRKRLYLQTLESVLSRSRKVLVDVESSGNVLYLPLDQLGVGGRSSAAMPPLVTPDTSNSQSAAERNAPPGRTTTREGRR
jgi:membrane protease subunit HflK